MQQKELVLCKNCFNCKIKNDKVSCKFGHFTKEDLEFLLHVPQDFDCEKYEEQGKGKMKIRKWLEEAFLQKYSYAEIDKAAKDQEEKQKAKEKKKRQLCIQK